MSTRIAIQAHRATTPGRTGASNLALSQRLDREHDPKPSQSTYAPVVPPRKGEYHTLHTGFPGGSMKQAHQDQAAMLQPAPAEVRPTGSVPLTGLESLFPSATQVPGTG